MLPDSFYFAAGTYIPARINEFTSHFIAVYNWLNTYWLVKFFTSAFLEIHALLDQGDTQMKKAITVYLFITWGWSWACSLYRLVTFEFINEEDKVVAEKKVIVGWNLLHEDGPAGSANTSSSSAAAAASPSRRRAASPSPRLTLKQDIKAFQQQVRAGKMKLSLITECTFMIDECVSEQSHIDNFVFAAQRRLPPAEYSDDREDFMIIFDYSRMGATTHIFKLLSKVSIYICA